MTTSQSPGSPKIDLAPPEDGSGFAGRGQSTSQSPGRPKIDLAPPGGGSGFASRGYTLTLLREKVYDPVLRGIHAWIALCVLLLLLTSQAAAWMPFTPEAASLWQAHVWLGYGLLQGLAARLTWALIGPKHAHWRHLWTWRAWLAALRRREWFSAPGGFGHHPVATAAYVGLYAALLVMTLSGLALAAIDQGQGPLLDWLGHAALLKPWFRAPHDWLEEVVLAFIVAHIAALMLHESRHGIPMAQAMVSGYQYRRED